jgi:lipopolysaccharide cholinephosphotransferase
VNKDNNKLIFLQKILNSMLQELCDFLDENNIKYFLTGGTLLGAIRHKGFIPWDDDIDIGMLRDEFEKFNIISQEFTNNKYFLQTLFTDFNFVRPHAKIRLNNSKIEYENGQSGSHEGVSISIFIFDNVSNVPFVRYIHYLRIRNLLGVLNYRQKRNEKSLIFSSNALGTTKRIFVYIRSFLTFPKNMIKLKTKISNLMVKWNKSKSVYAFPYAGVYKFRKEIFLVEDLEVLKTATFLNRNYYVSNNYENYLMRVYGNYMKLPEESARFPKHGINHVEVNENNRGEHND